MSRKGQAIGWAIQWRSHNRLDGYDEHFIGWFDQTMEPVPPRLQGYTTMVFKTRRDAREFIKERYGYIKDRPDLRTEPHGWMMPRPVKVRVTVEEA